MSPILTRNFTVSLLPQNFRMVLSKVTIPNYPYIIRLHYSQPFFYQSHPLFSLISSHPFLSGFSDSAITYIADYTSKCVPYLLSRGADAVGPACPALRTPEPYLRAGNNVRNRWNYRIPISLMMCFATISLPMATLCSGNAQCKNLFGQQIRERHQSDCFSTIDAHSEQQQYAGYSILESNACKQQIPHKNV